MADTGGATGNSFCVGTERKEFVSCSSHAGEYKKSVEHTTQAFQGHGVPHDHLTRQDGHTANELDAEEGGRPWWTMIGASGRSEGYHSGGEGALDGFEGSIGMQA